MRPTDLAIADEDSLRRWQDQNPRPIPVSPKPIKSSPRIICLNEEELGPANDMPERHVDPEEGVIGLAQKQGETGSRLEEPIAVRGEEPQLNDSAQPCQQRETVDPFAQAQTPKPTE